MAAPRRRDEALAFIIEQIAGGFACPSYIEIARALAVSDTRAKQLIKELIRDGDIERTPGAVRSLRVCDMARSRELLTVALVRMGWITGAEVAFPDGQLTRLPPITYLPDDD